MTVLEAIELFKSEMLNEIFHSDASESLQNALVKAVKDVEKTVIETYEASKQKK